MSDFKVTKRTSDEIFVKLTTLKKIATVAQSLGIKILVSDKQIKIMLERQLHIQTIVDSIEKLTLELEDVLVEQNIDVEKMLKAYEVAVK